MHDRRRRSEADREGDRQVHLRDRSRARRRAVAARRGVRDGARGQARGRARAVQEARHAASRGISTRASSSAPRCGTTGDAARRRAAARSRSPRSIPDHLPARRVLVLIHASRSDTTKLVAELEAIAARAPDDLDVKADLATAYGAVGEWDKAIASARADRQGRGRTISRCSSASATPSATAKSLAKALTWYGRACEGRAGIEPAGLRGRAGASSTRAGSPTRSARTPTSRGTRRIARRPSTRSA